MNINAGSVIADAIGGEGAVVNVNTNFATAANYSIGTLNIASGQVFAPTGDNTFTVSDALNNHGILAIGLGHTVTVDGNYNQDAAATLYLSAHSTSQYSQLAVTDTATFAAGSKIFVNATSGYTFTNGDVLANVVSADELSASTLTVSDNLAFYDFTPVIDGDTIDLNIAAVANPVETAVNTEGNNSAQGAAKNLDTIVAGTPDGDMITVITALQSLSTQDASNAASQTTPVVSGASTTAALDTMESVDRVIQARQDVNSGLSSGEDFQTNRNAWMKAFGSWADQDNNNGFTGYDASTYGVVAGLDGLANESTRIGGAFAYANSDIDSNNSAAPQSLKVNSYQGVFYGSYSLDAHTDANFQLDGGYNSNTSDRYVTFGGLNRTAKGDYGSWTSHVGTGLGRIFDVGHNTTFTPSARVDYSMIRNESYTETGAGSLNLHVNSQFADELVPAMEAKFNHTINSNFSAALNGGLGYNVLSSNDSITSNFVGGGSSFSTRGVDPSPWVVRTGAGLIYKTPGDTEIIARYDREDRGSSFDDQTVSLKIRAPF